MFSFCVTSVLVALVAGIIIGLETHSGANLVSNDIIDSKELLNDRIKAINDEKEPTIDHGTGKHNIVL